MKISMDDRGLSALDLFFECKRVSSHFSLSCDLVQNLLDFLVCFSEVVGPRHNNVKVQLLASIRMQFKNR